MKPPPLPAEGSLVNRINTGKMIAVIEFADGTEITVSVQSEAEAVVIVERAFKFYGNKVRGGYFATRIDEERN